MRPRAKKDPPAKKFRTSPGAWRFAALGGALLVGVVALLVVHGRWLVQGPKDARFMRFLRRYGTRNASEVIPDHGAAVDRNGAALDIAPEGSVFQRVLDACALGAEGGAVRLSIDADLQTTAETLMKRKMGAVVALEPTTGKIRALVSAPRAAYLDRALGGLYPPGSTFKVFMAAAALSNGLEPIYNCPASGYRSGPSTPAICDVEARQAARKGRVWKGFGRIGMGEALMHSSNVYFAQLGVAMGPETFGHAVEVARLRDPVTVLSSADVPLVSAGGGVPDGLRAAQLAPVAIGQGALQLTPLAVAMVTAAVADDGLLLAPTLDEKARPELRAQAFDFAAAGRVKTMMRAVVRSGTGRACDIAGLDVCGKTGTAETGRGKDHAWFTCFAPQKQPRLVVTVLVEHGGFGAEAALPVARALLLKARELRYFDS